MIDVTKLVEAALTLIAAIITVLLIPYIKSKLGDAKFNTLERWVKTAVKAAEQIYKGSGRGEEKRQYVLTFLASKGLTIDIEVVEALLESAVFGLNAV